MSYLKETQEFVKLVTEKIKKKIYLDCTIKIVF